MLHCVDYNSECLPFFLHQKIFQSQIYFHKGVETLCVACKSNLGKRSGRKTGTGQVEYLGHASAESQAKEETFESHLFLTCTSFWCSRCSQHDTAVEAGDFLMSFDVLSIPIRNALYLFTSFLQVLQCTLRLQSLRIASRSSR